MNKQEIYNITDETEELTVSSLNSDEEDDDISEPSKNIKVSVDTEKIQKKRGRKPKQKDDEDEVLIEKIPKKRGRKPKEKIYSVKELPKTFFEENKNETLILHLPIKSSESITEQTPLPDINKGIEYSIYDEEWINYKINDDNLLPTQQNFLDSAPVQYDTINEPKEDIKTNKVVKKNLRNILYEFINSNNDKTWPTSTNIHCWWCCNQFTCTPTALPEYYKKDKFYVGGVFCSFNCAASYNFSKNDDNMWERFSLLNLMYKKLYNQKFVKINLSIEEFRENSLRNDKTFSVISPPLISIIPKIEENISNTTKNSKNNYPLVNESILNKTQNNLKLKRNKPVTNTNSTLQSFMDLKII